MPRPAQVAATAIPLVVLLGILLLVRQDAQRHVAVGPSPSACAITTCASPSPSPSPSPSESPSPSPPAPPPPAPPAALPPPPPVPCAAGGGEPGGNIAANYPVAFAFAPDGRLFWAERSGTVKVWQAGGPRVFASVATSTSGERGLLGLALSPSFASDRYVYAMYSETDNAHQTVVRWTDCGGQGASRTTIVAGLPTGSDCCHKGGRIAFGPGGFLYVTVGDNHQAPAAQAPCDPRGKVLRYTASGQPAGTGCGAMWVSGLRNPFGIAFAPDGTLALTNNGPSGDAGTPCGGCGDEVYVVGRAGGVNYQWPYCWGYSHPFNGSGGCHNLPPPQYSTEGGGGFPQKTPFFVAPTGMTYANGHFLFCAYSTHRMYQYNGEGSVSDTGLTGCELDVKQGPDGALFTSDEGMIYRH